MPSTATAFAPAPIPFIHPSSTHQLTAKPLTPAIGAVVEGIDLSRPLSATQKDEIHKLLLRYQVIFFRKQTLSAPQQRDFAKNFGSLHIHPVFPTVPDVPEAIVLDTAKNDLKDNALWHTDVTFQKNPPMGAVLTPRLLPETGGGDTLWASGTAAYNALPDDIKQRIDGLTAQHDFLRSFPVSRYGRTEEERKKWAETRDRFPPVTHPVVRIHPETQQKALFVNEGFTTKINELGPDEGSSLLAYLLQHATKPEFSLRWRWEEGDVAFWDNRITQHYAVDDYRPARRIMNRVTIIGDQPYGPTPQKG